MSDFLSSLMARSFRAAPAIEPRLPSLFESAAAPAGGLETEIVVERGPLRPAAPPVGTDAPATRGDAPTPINPVPDPAPGNATPPLSPPLAIAPRRVAGESTAAAAQPVTQPATTVRPPAPPESAEPDAPPAVPARPVPREPALPFRTVTVAPPRRGTARALEPESSAAAPTVHVTIGRIEVRAIQPPPPAARPARRAPPKLSLEEYLHPRPGGAR